MNAIRGILGDGGRWGSVPIVVGTQTGRYAPCQGVREPMIPRGAIRDDLLVATTYGALVVLRTDGVIVSAAALQHGIVRSGPQLRVGVARCDGLRLIAPRDRASAVDLRRAADPFQSDLTDFTSAGPALFVSGDRHRRGRGLGLALVRASPNGQRTGQPSSCAVQPSSSHADEVIESLTGASCSSFARPPACSWCAFGSLVRRGPSRTLRREVHRGRRSGHTSSALTRSKDKHPSAVEKIRAALVAEVHHAVVAAVHGEPSTLRVEGPSAVSAALLRVVVGHERALRRSGFRVVECVAVDPDDERGRHGRWRAVVPEDGAAWEWQRTTGEALQEAVMRGDDLRPRPRPIGAEPVATVHSLAAARRARSRR